MSMWVCRVVWCCVLCCVVLCCAVLHWGLAALKPCLHFGDETDPSAGLQPIRAHTLLSFASVWMRKTARPPVWTLSHGAEEEKKRSLPEMILVTGSCIVVLSFFFSTPPAQHRVAFLFSPSGPFFFPLSAERRCRWWSAKLKTPCPLWWEGWCRTDTTTTTTITQVAARPADRTACRRASPTAGRISWTSPRSSCSTPPSTRRGRCWR